MSAILDLDQIACSGNGVVSDKHILPALTHLAGSLQQGILVQIWVQGAGLLCGFPKNRVTAAGSWKGKAGAGLSWLVCHYPQQTLRHWAFSL